MVENYLTMQKCTYKRSKAGLKKFFLRSKEEIINTEKI